MALFLGSRGNDVSTLRATGELTARLRQKIAVAQGVHGAEAVADFLAQLSALFTGECASEQAFLAAHAGLIADIATADTAALPAIVRRCRLLVQEQYVRRRAPLLVHTALRSFDDALLRRVFALAGAPADGEWCWLACGWLGRGEVSFGSGLAGSYIGSDPQGIGARVEQLLANCGYGVDCRPICGGLKGHATLDDWQAAVAALTASGDERCSSLTDLRWVAGNTDFGKAALTIARNGLARWRQSAQFSQAARETSSMRVALGFFGGLKVERSGEHRGAINIDGQALCPLALNLRFMSIAFDLAVTDTPSRLRELVRLHRLNVDPASRLMEAFHQLQCLKLDAELAPDASSSPDRYVWPERLSLPEQESLKESLEAIAALGRLVVQQLVGSV